MERFGIPAEWLTERRVLSSVCVRHGEIATHTRRARVHTRPPRWAYLLIPFGVLPFVVALLVLRRTVPAAAWPFCDECTRRRRWFTVGGAALVAVGVDLAAWSVALATTRPVHAGWVAATAVLAAAVAGSGAALAARGTAAAVAGARLTPEGLSVQFDHADREFIFDVCPGEIDYQAWERERLLFDGVKPIYEYR